MREIARQRSRGKDRDCNDRRKPILAASHLSDNRCFRQPARGTECYNFEVRQQFLRRAPAFPLAPLHKVGEWLSLVEHLVRDQGVGGSNPLSPTNSFNSLHTLNKLKDRPSGFSPGSLVSEGASFLGFSLSNGC